MILIQKQITICTRQEFILSSMIAWKKLFNEYPSKETVGLIYSQYHLETGSKSWNWNISNIKVGKNLPSDTKYISLAGTWEIINGKKVIFPEGHPQTFFRAFDTLAEGLEHHLTFLSSKSNYKKAWLILGGSNPDPIAFAQALKSGGYYTASVADYSKGLKSIFNSYLKTNEYQNALDTIQSEPIKQFLKQLQETK